MMGDIVMELMKAIQFSRKGLSSPDFSYPRVLGIEGVVVLS